MEVLPLFVVQLMLVMFCNMIVFDKNGISVLRSQELMNPLTIPAARSEDSSKKAANRPKPRAGLRKVYRIREDLL